MALDILRLEILNKFGVVYVDIDDWCVDSLDDIVTNANYDTMTANSGPFHFSAALVILDALNSTMD